MFDDLVKKVKDELLSGITGRSIEYVRDVGSRWGFQYVDLRARNISIRVQFEVGFYEVLFGASFAPEWFSADEVYELTRFRPSVVSSNSADGVLQPLKEFLQKKLDSANDLFSAQSYKETRSALLAIRAHRCPSSRKM